jgi:hypothetical protein
LQVKSKNQTKITDKNQTKNRYFLYTKSNKDYGQKSDKKRDIFKQYRSEEVLTSGTALKLF